MSNEQINSNQYIAQAVAEASRLAIQTMSVAGTARTENAGPRMNRPIMKQPTFNWSSKEMYAGLRNFKLEVKPSSKVLIKVKQKEYQIQRSI